MTINRLPELVDQPSYACLFPSIIRHGIADHWHVYQSADVRSVYVPQGPGMHCPCHSEVRLLFHHSDGPSKLITFKH